MHDIERQLFIINGGVNPKKQGLNIIQPLRMF